MVLRDGVLVGHVWVVVAPTTEPPPATQIFTADHPFVFYITVNDVVLFEGRVLVPNY